MPDPKTLDEAVAEHYGEKKPADAERESDELQAAVTSHYDAGETAGEKTGDDK